MYTIRLCRHVAHRGAWVLGPLSLLVVDQGRGAREIGTRKRRRKKRARVRVRLIDLLHTAQLKVALGIGFAIRSEGLRRGAIIVSRLRGTQNGVPCFLLFVGL